MMRDKSSAGRVAMLYRFHANVFASPRGSVCSVPITLRGKSLCKLASEDGGPPRLDGPLSVGWESAAEYLAALPRMIFEPDGSFVWSGQVAHHRWQVDGHLFEYSFHGAPRLHRLELHGECIPQDFDRLLKSVGWPAARLCYELVMDGVTLDEAGFRRWATVSTENDAALR